MAVPANPKLTQVIAEFAAPATTKLSQFLRGGAYVPESPTNAAVPTALPIKLSQLAGAANVIPPRVNTQGGFVGSGGTAQAGTYARYALTTAGVEQTTSTPMGTVVIGNWILSGVATDYNVKAHVTADNGYALWSGDQQDQWLDFASVAKREWTYGAGIIGEIGQATLQIDVRDKLTGLPVDGGPAFVTFESERIDDP